MNKRLLLMLARLCLAVGFAFAAVGMAAAQDWEEEFQHALAEIREAGEPADGLGYSPSQEGMLDEAIGNALVGGGGSSQLMKMAVDAGLDPYAVLVSIYSQDSVDIDELCLTATEQGMSKAVIVQAAVNATGPGGQPACSRDEITQAQCLLEGLPYTLVQAQPPPPNPPDPTPVGPSSP